MSFVFLIGQIKRLANFRGNLFLKQTNIYVKRKLVLSNLLCVLISFHVSSQLCFRSVFKERRLVVFPLKRTVSFIYGIWSALR